MDNEKRCSQYTLSLIQSVMNETEVPPLPPEIGLDSLYAFSRKHNIEALLYYGLCRLAQTPADPVWHSWENRIHLLLAQGAVQLTDRDMLFDALTAAGIPLLPVKGCWLKELYPNIEYRQMADLDMLIPPEKAIAAKELLLSMGYSTNAFDDSPNHASFSNPPYTEVELHVSLLPGKNRYYDNVWDRVAKVEGYPCLYRFSPEDEYIFYLLHLNKHLEDAGTGLRSVLDSVVYRRAYPHMDREYLKKELTGLGLWTMAVQIETLADCWFVTGDPVPKELEGLAQGILQAGSYGTIDNRSQHRLDRLEKKYSNPFIRFLVYWVTQTCRPLSEMRQSYPILCKLPVLLPVFWVVRAVMKFAAHPQEIWHHICLVFEKGRKHG